jgi:hypothetical protein
MIDKRNILAQQRKDNRRIHIMTILPGKRKMVTMTGISNKEKGIRQVTNERTAAITG